MAGDLCVAIVPFVTSSQYFERGFVAVLKVAFGFHAGFGVVLGGLEEAKVTRK